MISHRAYIHILMDSVLLLIVYFLLIVVEHAIIVIAVYRRPVTVVRKSPERLKHSEPRGYISNNCKAKQVRDDEAMTESWRNRDKGPISAATVTHAGQVDCAVYHEEVILFFSSTRGCSVL